MAAFYFAQSHLVLLVLIRVLVLLVLVLFTLESKFYLREFHRGIQKAFINHIYVLNPCRAESTVHLCTGTLEWTRFPIQYR